MTVSTLLGVGMFIWSFAISLYTIRVLAWCRREKARIHAAAERCATLAVNHVHLLPERQLEELDAKLKDAGLVFSRVQDNYCFHPNDAAIASRVLLAYFARADK